MLCICYMVFNDFYLFSLLWKSSKMIINTDLKISVELQFFCESYPHGLETTLFIKFWNFELIPCFQLLGKLIRKQIIISFREDMGLSANKFPI